MVNLQFKLDKTKVLQFHLQLVMARVAGELTIKSGVIDFLSNNFQ
jgi:hypothetical protein